jgi:hypothetical protein
VGGGEVEGATVEGGAVEVVVEVEDVVVVRTGEDVGGELEQPLAPRAAMTTAPANTHRLGPMTEPAQVNLLRGDVDRYCKYGRCPTGPISSEFCILCPEGDREAPGVLRSSGKHASRG